MHNNTYFIEFLWWLNESVFRKCLEQYLAQSSVLQTCLLVKGICTGLDKGRLRLQPFLPTPHSACLFNEKIVFGHHRRLAVLSRVWFFGYLDHPGYSNRRKTQIPLFHQMLNWQECHAQNLVGLFWFRESCKCVHNFLFGCICLKKLFLYVPFCSIWSFILPVTWLIFFPLNKANHQVLTKSEVPWGRAVYITVCPYKTSWYLTVHI